MQFVKYLIASLVILLTTAACNPSKNIIYFQDVTNASYDAVNSDYSITVQPKDMLAITVSCKDPDLAVMFNLPTVSYTRNSEIVNGASQQQLAYVVDMNGDINFPVLGKIHVAGLSRWQVQEKIKTEIKNRKLLKDLVVTVEFRNFKISILGEVNKPGSYRIEGDKVTILEALSMAGDLTIYGQRDEIYVIREEDNERTTYKVDLRSTDLFKSPVYYLKQNDIVYVQPNKVRAGQSTINENNAKSVSLWISVASLLASLGVLIVNIIDN